MITKRGGRSGIISKNSIRMMLIIQKMIIGRLRKYSKVLSPNDHLSYAMHQLFLQNKLIYGNYGITIHSVYKVLQRI